MSQVLSPEVKKKLNQQVGQLLHADVDYFSPERILDIIRSEKINLINPDFDYYATEYPWLAVIRSGIDREFTASGNTLEEAVLTCFIISRKQ